MTQMVDEEHLRSIREELEAQILHLGGDIFE